MKGAHYPYISVIVPARNEEKYIGRLLDSIIISDYPKERLKVLICDGQSEDDTKKIVQEYATKNPFIHLLINEKRTTPFAFNLGIKNASPADIIITVSAHAEIYPDFFHKTVEAFSISPEIGCVGGFSENVFENATSEVIGLAMSSPFGVGNAHFRTGTKDGYVDTVSFPAYKKDVFERTGTFNEALTRNQDDEFNYRVLKSGFKIYLSRKIKSRYYVRGSYKKLYKQYFQYGYWKVYVNQLHKTITTTRQLIPAAFVCFVVLGLINSLFSSMILYAYISIWIIYLIGATYFASKKASNFYEGAKIVFTFLVLHWSYGTGYLKGIFDFLILKKVPGEKAEQLSR